MTVHYKTDKYHEYILNKSLIYVKKGGGGLADLELQTGDQDSKHEYCQQNIVIIVVIALNS